MCLQHVFEVARSRCSKSGHVQDHFTCEPSYLTRYDHLEPYLKYVTLKSRLKSPIKRNGPPVGISNLPRSAVLQLCPTGLCELKHAFDILYVERNVLY